MTTRPAPKPQKPPRGGVEAERYHTDVRSFGCWLCGHPEVDVHHVAEGRYAQRKGSDFEVIALCRSHHDFRHRQPKAFREMYGPEATLAADTKQAVERLRKQMIGGRP